MLCKQVSSRQEASMCACIDPNSCFTKFWIRVVSQMRSCTHQICLNGDQAVAMKPRSAPAVASIHGGTWDSTTAAPCFVRACTTAARPTSAGPRISSSLRRRRACCLLRGCVQGTCRSAWECRTGLATQPAAAEEAARDERAHDAPSPSRLAAAAWSCCRAQACIRSPCAMSLKWLARTRPEAARRTTTCEFRIRRPLTESWSSGSASEFSFLFNEQLRMHYSVQPAAHPGEHGLPKAHSGLMRALVTLRPFSQLSRIGPCPSLRSAPPWKSWSPVWLAAEAGHPDAGFRV